jgi:predicted Zn-dependent protease with MMP-like domain
VWIDQDHFAALVADALDALPPAVLAWLDNVDVLVEDWPTRRQRSGVGLRGRGTLLGLYEGVPLTARGGGYHLVAPDRITLFRGPILALCRSEAEVRAEIQRTVVHELAHHFGIDDDRLDELDAY